MLVRLLSASRPAKRLVSVAYDAAVIPLAIYCSIFFRVGEYFSPIQWPFYMVIAVTTLVTLACFVKFGLYRAILRFMAHQAVITVVACTLVSAATLVFTSYLMEMRIYLPTSDRTIALPRSTPFIYLSIALLALGVPRLMVRSIVHFYLAGRSRKARRDRKPIIVYGAGQTGYQIAGSLIQSGTHYVVGFIDDDKRLANTTVRGINVHRSDELRHLVELYQVKTVLLALGLVPKSRQLAIVESLSTLGIRIQTIPAVEDIVSGKAELNDIRDVKIEDLLGRDPIPPRKNLLCKRIKDHTVMVTGAGGSIGSELCRQIVALKPTVLVLFEQNEYALYRIQQELKLLAPDINCVAILGSTLNRKQLREVIQAYQVATIYHAAAYKHVPMVEENLVEGVRNNVMGTWECMRAAMEAEVDSFVLISTDKAVRPTNAMGASKRVAELLLQAAATEKPATIFSMVRFGNVLGSSGSVVPKFRSQITRGGPVTVTHKNISRYFMTIPEAAQLVLQASAMAKRGDMFVLDMGEPVIIWELAERMIRLSGLSVKSAENPGGDIEIRQTGLRPGEKLYEELLISKAVTGTEHPLIMRASEDCLPWEETRRLVSELEYACASYDIQSVKKLLNNPLVHYSPAQDNHDLLASKREIITQLKAEKSKVTPLRPRFSAESD